MKGFNAFICYLNVPDDTGYKLELYNPSTADGIRLISNILEENVYWKHLIYTYYEIAYYV